MSIPSVYDRSSDGFDKSLSSKPLLMLSIIYYYVKVVFQLRLISSICLKFCPASSVILLKLKFVTFPHKYVMPPHISPPLKIFASPTDPPKEAISQ